MRMTWWMLVLVVACKGDDAAKSRPTPMPGTGSAPAPDAAAIARPNIEIRGVDLPEVVRGLEPLEDPQRPTLVVTKTGIIVEGKLVVAIQEGVIDPSEKEGGAMGMKIAKLSNLLAQIPRAASLHLLFDKTTPYRVMIEVMFSAKQKEAGWKSFDILARQNGVIVRAPITLPDKPAGADDNSLAIRRPGADLEQQLEPGKPKPRDAEPAGNPEPAPHLDARPVQLVIAMTKTEVIVFSISGLEGTLEEPKLAVPLSDTTAPERVGKTLADIAQRRAAKEPVVLMADAETSVQRVVEMIAAIRATHPDIQFASGFE